MLLASTNQATAAKRSPVAASTREYRPETRPPQDGQRPRERSHPTAGISDHGFVDDSQWGQRSWCAGGTRAKTGTTRALSSLPMKSPSAPDDTTTRATPSDTRQRSRWRERRTSMEISFDSASACSPWRREVDTRAGRPASLDGNRRCRLCSVEGGRERSRSRARRRKDVHSGGLIEHLQVDQHRSAVDQALGIPDRLLERKNVRPVG